MRRVKQDLEHDNSPQALERRAKYAEVALRNEARIVAADVGPVMAVAALLGIAVETARANGVSKSAFQAMLIELLHEMNKTGAAR